MAQKIDSLLDVGKISSEIEIIAKKMSEEFGKATNLSTFTAGGVGAGNTKEFDDMKKQIADLEAKIKQYNNAKQQQLTIEQKVANDENTLEFLRKKARLKGDDMVERLKNEIAILNLRIAEQEKTVYPNGKENKPEGVKREDYIRMMGVLNKNGYKSDLDMTVIDFIEANRLFKKECEANEKQLRELKSRK